MYDDAMCLETPVLDVRKPCQVRRLDAHSPIVIPTTPPLQLSGASHVSEEGIGIPD
jgi:hypothetical protein